MPLNGQFIFPALQGKLRQKYSTFYSFSSSSKQFVKVSDSFGYQKEVCGMQLPHSFIVHLLIYLSLLSRNYQKFCHFANGPNRASLLRYDLRFTKVYT